MLIPTLFSLGFSATAVTTKPAPVFLVLTLAYALLQRYHHHFALSNSLAIFMGALAATVLGKPAQWQNATIGQPPWLVAMLSAFYGVQLYVMGGGAAAAYGEVQLMVLLMVLMLEHEMLDPDPFFSKLACHCAAVIFCLLVDPPRGGCSSGGDTGSVLHIYCTLVVVAGCWLVSHGKATWVALKNALHWGPQ